jgi:hypothetical protein
LARAARILWAGKTPKRPDLIQFLLSAAEFVAMVLKVAYAAADTVPTRALVLPAKSTFDALSALSRVTPHSLAIALVSWPRFVSTAVHLRTHKRLCAHFEAICNNCTILPKPNALDTLHCHTALFTLIAKR